MKTENTKTVRINNAEINYEGIDSINDTSLLSDSVLDFFINFISVYILSKCGKSSNKDTFSGSHTDDYDRTYVDVVNETGGSNNVESKSNEAIFPQPNIKIHLKENNYFNESDVFIFNTLFYTKLLDGFQYVRRWTKKLNQPIWMYRYIFIPVYIKRNSHWLLAIIANPNVAIYRYICKILNYYIENKDEYKTQIVNRENNKSYFYRTSAKNTWTVSSERILGYDDDMFMYINGSKRRRGCIKANPENVPQNALNHREITSDAQSISSCYNTQYENNVRITVQGTSFEQKSVNETHRSCRDKGLRTKIKVRQHLDKAFIACVDSDFTDADDVTSIKKNICNYFLMEFLDKQIFNCDPTSEKSDLRHSRSDMNLSRKELSVLQNFFSSRRNCMNVDGKSIKHELDDMHSVPDKFDNTRRRRNSVEETKHSERQSKHRATISGDPCKRSTMQNHAHTDTETGVNIGSREAQLTCTGFHTQAEDTAHYAWGETWTSLDACGVSSQTCGDIDVFQGMTNDNFYQNWLLIPGTIGPKQQNGYDCGVFVIECISSFIREKPFLYAIFDYYHGLHTFRANHEDTSIKKDLKLSLETQRAQLSQKWFSQRQITLRRKMMRRMLYVMQQNCNWEQNGEVIDQLIMLFTRTCV